MSSNREKLVCTGERVIEDDYKASQSSYLIYLFHIATYRFCLPFVRNKRVLDFGCGSGYGTHLLSADCEQITGIDISADAIAYAKDHYRKDNLDYLRVSNIEDESLPFENDTFDTVISFQVMEHIRLVDKYLSEIRRVLRKDGKLVIATPDRTTRLFPGQKPWNVYHVTEYSPSSFGALVRDFFPGTDLYGMSGRKDVLDIERRRTRALRISTYLFTFPFCPEWYRQSMLRLLKYCDGLIGRFRKAGTTQDVQEQKYEFDVEDIQIEREVDASVNIVSVSTNTKTRSP
ncbi:MAG: putative glycosyltransferase [Gammaproteobacteria bacterium]|nr:MAG: putative glycosyltransferase [Gammaproteobacteria bacterium]TND03658.1 MAG: putative glycosyltransferase [Gammaproteobacteria bacterium]